MHLKSVLLAAGLAMFAAHAGAQMSGVIITEPPNGTVVTSPFKVKFQAREMKVLPAGDMTPNTGHHHLIINGSPVASGDVVPFDATHLHFGKGQTETELTLPPGRYTLTLQFANGAHQSYGETMSETIEVTVK
jgi:hypothetical protein